MILVILIILILYVNKILQYRFGWNKNIVTNRSAHPNVSVVVSIRNTISGYEKTKSDNRILKSGIKFGNSKKPNKPKIIVVIN